MKIAIISVNMHTKVLNFASPLHTVAFQQFLLQNGIESTVLDYEPCYRGKMDIRHPLFFYVDHPDPNPEKQKELLKKWKDLFYEREYRYDRFKEFIQENYIKTDEVYDISNQEVRNEDESSNVRYFSVKSMDDKIKMLYRPYEVVKKEDEYSLDTLIDPKPYSHEALMLDSNLADLDRPAYLRMRK